MDLELAGKVVLVTGGSAGLGRATADKLAQEGARVAICARGKQRLDEAATWLRRHGGEVEAIPADVVDSAAAQDTVDAVVSRWGRLDGLVNNAGVHAGKPFEATEGQEWVDDLELKVLAAARLIRSALPHLEVRGGSVVNVLSTHAKAPPPSSMPSSVSRGAGLALTKGLAHDLGPHRIRVNALLVGFIESDQWVRLAAATGREVEDFTTDKAQKLRIPLGRVGRAEEFADVAAFLLSERASYLTGTAINVDGGLSPVV